MASDREVQRRKTEGFFADCKRLALGEPLGYLIGHVPFLDCVIWLDSHPLIPRSETEFWVEKAIEVIANQAEQPGLFSSTSPEGIEQTSRKTVSKNSLSGELDSCLCNSLRAGASINILDLCAGSGCIGVAVGKAIPEAGVDFAEIDARLLPTIEKNIRTNNLDPFKTTIHHTNLFSKIPAEKKYDFILSNPPYIDPALDRTEPSVKVHEPHLALYGGRGGTEIIAAIIAAAPTHLNPGGQLWIEHEPEQAPFIQATAAEHNFTVTAHKDQYNVERYSILIFQSGY